MGWDKARNLRVRGNFSVGGTQTFTGATTFSGLATFAAGGTVPLGQSFGLRLPGGVGTAGVGTADLQALRLSYGGGSPRLTGNVGGTVYVWLGIAQP